MSTTDSYVMSQARRPEIGWLLRRLGARWRDGRTIRFRWGEFSTTWGVSFGLCLFGEGYSLHVHPGWGSVFIPILRGRKTREPHEMMEKWGISIFRYDAHLQWGDKTKVVHFPWDWKHVRHEIYRKDGTWGPFIGSWEEKTPGEDGRLTLVEPYRYLNLDGVKQSLTATYCVEEREWRWRWFAWLPWPRHIQRCIDVSFSEEVGSERGSWKGGTVGCGYQMRRGETPQECLRRMERERRFDRR